MSNKSFGKGPGFGYSPPLGGLGMDRRPKKKGKDFDLFDNYQSFELKGEHLEGMEDHFKAWLEDDSICEPYKDLELVRDEKVIVRLYVYKAVMSSTLVASLDGKALEGMKILPYVKVLKASDKSKLKPGDVLIAPYDIADMRTSMAWLEWSHKMENERPAPVGIPEPSKFAGLLGNWEADIVKLDVFNPSENDEFTFCRSEMEFKAIYRKAKR